MLKSAFSQLRAHPGRFAAVCLAIVLGVGFAASTLVFTASFEKALITSVSGEVSKIDVEVNSADGEPLDLKELSTVPGVAAVEPKVYNYVDFSGASGHGSLSVTNIPATESMRWYSLAAGTWPADDGQLVVDLGTAERNGLAVGSAITLEQGEQKYPVTISGLVDTKISAIADASDNAFAPLGLVRQISGDSDFPYEAYLLTAPGTTPDQLAADLNSTPGDKFSARTAESIGQERVENLSNGTDVISVILLSFAALAGLVAAMVVANTFTILLTQRRRQIALMRCIGATGSQVRRTALAEAAMIAVIGTVLGIGVGVGVGRIAVGVAGIRSESFTVSTLSMVIVAVLGVVVTLVAALGPTARAMKIPPMAALRPVDTAEQQKTASIVRNSIGLLLFLGGGAILAGGMYLGDLLIAMAGGAVTAVGVLVLLRTVLPWVLKLFGGLGSLAGSTGKLAVSNTLRNPVRAAATCTALIIGVGAIVTLQVAAASAKAGADASLSLSRPLDLQISTYQEELPQSLATAVAGIDGVAAVVGIAGTQIGLDDEPGSDYRLYGATNEQIDQVLHAGTLLPGTIAVPGWIAEGLKPGDPVTINRNGVEKTFAMSTLKITDDGSFVVPATDLAAFDPNAVTEALWLKFADDASPNEIISAVNPLIAPYSDLGTSGSGTERAALEDLLDTLILVALALLAVAVVIAIVGIGNTLGLSVVERTRESALLRALGLRRGQLRQMLALEALLLAMVAAVVGILFGVIFGFAAATAAFGEAGYEVMLTVPWGELTLVFAGALAAGVLASVLPGRRAAQATPVEALAEV